MKICGFSFIRNAVSQDYPIVEAVTSILPICDSFVIAVGRSEDDTLGRVRSIGSDKLRIIETVWDDSLRKGGAVLAAETDKAFDAIDPDADWAFYIQGDEVVHEDDLPRIRTAMETHLHDRHVDGLLFRYRHFYGSYEHVGASNKWYGHEIRVVRNDPSIRSYRDAQGFRKRDGGKLRVKPVDAWIHHYGWVREPAAMRRKLDTFGRIYRDEGPSDPSYAREDFRYEDHITRLERFTGTHPAVMRDRISRLNWDFDCDISFSRKRMKDRAKDLLRRIGIDTNYRNYRIV